MTDARYTEPPSSPARLRRPATLLAVAGAFALSACASTPPDDPSDPLEPVNRAVFKFNRTADRYVLRPVAKGYKKVTPELAQRGVRNFFSNLEEPRTIVNGVLQAKFGQATADTGRFLLNTTVGLVGLIDVATDVGLEKHNEDFGQTLGYYKVGPGWYLMLPLLGPASNRDLVGRAGDTYSSVTSYLGTPEVYVTNGVNIVDVRAQLLDADSLLDNALDPYIFVRTAYLQRRLSQVYDGSPPAALMYGDDGSGETEEDGGDANTSPVEAPAAPAADAPK